MLWAEQDSLIVSLDGDSCIQAPGYDVVTSDILATETSFSGDRPRDFGENNVMASGSGDVSSGHDAELDELLDS